MRSMMQRPDIVAPAGDMTMLQAVLTAGADAVYLGLDTLNMRQIATRNFTRESLPEASARCRAHGVQCYLTCNTLVYEDEVDVLRDLLRFARPYVDAVIVADWAAIIVCQEEDIPFHVSTQMSCANSATAQFLRAQGAQRVVLARECTLEEVAAINRKADLPVEAFVHGAVCLAVSGRCLLSHAAYGHSASRGACRQPCRRMYHIKEVQEGDQSDAEFQVGAHTILSARDLCSLPFVDQLMAAGIAACKIEGRARTPEYAATVVRAYREAVDAVCEGTFDAALVERLMAECAKVYHRPFGTGLYYGRPGEGQFAETDQNQATRRKLHVGIVLNYYAQVQVAHLQVQGATFGRGDTLAFHGPATGVVEVAVSDVRRDADILERAEKGNWVTVPCPVRVRRGDKVYLVVPVGEDELGQADG